MKYGIPEFRLPNKVVDVEIENLAKMGVNFIKDCIIGKTISVEQLEEEGFKGVFVASGAGLPAASGIILGSAVALSISLIALGWREEILSENV